DQAGCGELIERALDGCQPDGTAVLGESGGKLLGSLTAIYPQRFEGPDGGLHHASRHRGASKDGKADRSSLRRWMRCSILLVVPLGGRRGSLVGGAAPAVPTQRISSATG